MDKEVKQILKQKDDIIKKQQDLIQQKDHLIEEKDEEIKQLKKSLQESKNQLRGTSNPIGSDQKQTKVEHKKTQTDEDIQKNQLFSQEQRIKYQQENRLHEQTILPHAEKCEVESLPEYAVANKAVSTTVILKDIQGRPITNCSDSINMKMQNTSTKQIAPLTIFDVKELENGQYYLQFIIEEIGGYKLYIFFNEHIIKASCRYIISHTDNLCIVKLEV